MSTKLTLRHSPGDDAAPGFHLYEDVLDNSVADTEGEEIPAYLQLDQVGVQLETRGSFVSSVTLTLPRALARELGLLPPGA